MLRIIIFFCFINFCFSSAQNIQNKTFEKDTLILIKKNYLKHFNNDYVLFIPKGTPKQKHIFLLVEPNNTGKTSDSLEVHLKSAVDLASVSSVGNNISTMLKIPLLVPVFPRPSSLPNIYSHALDRDVMLKTPHSLHRIDLQLIAMINDSRKILESLNILVNEKIFMNGFSASATFTNRFSFLHPEMIEALAIGGFNGELMFPQKEINKIVIDYPIGIADFKKLFGKNFDLATYKTIPQFIYMGEFDENDAVQFDDAYSIEERKIINNQIGNTVKKRYQECQKIYNFFGINATFRNYENVGHWTTSAINLEVIKFFFAKMIK